MQLPAAAPCERKIIHIDMDCFYAAVEMREHPELAGQPIAVGGRSTGRGVLTTCNYEARAFGCRSAMPAFKAMQRCPNLVILPVRFDLYRAESRRIREIFHSFTEVVEPLSLDEAYLDVSHLITPGAAVAEEIRFRINDELVLTASAGIAPNKLIAKIASDWRKPDGQFEVTSEGIPEFMRDLSVRKIWGVGGKTAERLAAIGAETCGQLQKVGLSELQRGFGKFGAALYELCRGIDSRPVSPDRERKSLSNETTFSDDLPGLDAGLRALLPLVDELEAERAGKHSDREVRSAFVKVKFADFQQTTAGCQTSVIEREVYEGLLENAWARGGGKAVRLIGVGVRFTSQASPDAPVQLGLGL